MRFYNFFSWLSVASAAVIVPREGGLETRQGQVLPDLTIEGATLTSKWIEGSDHEQVVEMVVTNRHATTYLTWDDRLTISVESDSLDTITPGTLIRLAPNQSAIVQVGVKNKAGVDPGTRCGVKAVATWGGSSGMSRNASQTISGLCGFGDYAATADSLSHHWNPDWYNDVKFGIFIHWGIYAVPSYGNEPGPKQDYAEWYGFRMIQPDFRSETYQYHRETYGEDFNYDQFMGNFTDEFFDAKDWLDLIAGSGAQYFVPVTKHHDGWALFNHSETISRRSTVHYGPKRDFIRELMDTAKAEHPEIRRGTYFSMPEWFNPAYVEYGWDQNYQGNYYGLPPRNPYTNESIEYTGFVEVPDFLDDIQVPQMEALAYDYGTEIMWCDIGGPNNSPQFLSQWANWARDQGRQITWNNRCGLGGDWDTPEYHSGSFQMRKFESNRGMDPFSFGFNHLTKNEDYMTGENIVIDLVSIVANNGNYLLNIGPRADGSIVEAQRRNLLDAGEWIHAHGDGIFGTRFWNVAQQTGNFRYVVKPEAFFIHHIGKPESRLIFTDPVPWMEGDVVVVVGGSANGSEISASRNADGQVVFDLSEDVVNGDKYVWTFKVQYAAR